MSVETIKSTSISNLDAGIANSGGGGAGDYLMVQTEYVTVSASASAGSKYPMIRLPTTARLKSLVIESEAMGAGKVNLSLYYSDSTTDGTSSTNQGNLVAGGDQLFASDVDLTSAITGTQIINENGTFPLSKRNQPLWQAAGLTSDPGGFMDLVYVVHTTDITTGAARLGLRAEYTV